MSKNLVLLVAFALCSHAQASKSSLNLQGLNTQDICGSPVVSVSLNETTQPAMAKKITDLLIRQDNLFGTDFLKNKRDCTIFLKVSVIALPVESGTRNILGYAFYYNLYLESIISKIDLSANKKTTMIQLGLYDIGTLVLTDKASFESDVLKKTEESFQEFVIDWRSAH